VLPAAPHPSRSPTRLPSTPVGSNSWRIDSQCDDPTDSGIGEKYATINVTKATFLGVPDDCDVVVDEETAGPTGTNIPVTAEHTHTVGVGVIGTDGLITHTLTDGWAGDSTWAGATVITPEWDVMLDPEATDEREVEFNLYPFHANDYWSCTNDRNSSVSTDIAETDGATFHMPGIGEMNLSGVSIELDDSTSGSFISISEATVISVQSETSQITQTCYSSDDEGNRIDPHEE
jgi:hypothetical protein